MSMHVHSNPQYFKRHGKHTTIYCRATASNAIRNAVAQSKHTATRAQLRTFVLCLRSRSRTCLLKACKLSCARRHFTVQALKLWNFAMCAALLLSLSSQVCNFATHTAQRLFGPDNRVQTVGSRQQVQTVRSRQDSAAQTVGSRQ